MPAAAAAADVIVATSTPNITKVVLFEKKM